MESELRICPYHHDHQAPVTLMMDDLAPTAITVDGRLDPSNDHGYGLKGKGGLFAYLEKELFDAFPEIKGTFFILTGRHTNHWDGIGGRRILWRGFDEGFISFLKELAEDFDLAFHGVHHLHHDPKTGERRMEFVDKGLADLELIRESIDAFTQSTGIEFQGVKLPGYARNEHSEQLIKELGFKWWAYSSEMMGRKGENQPFLDQKGSLLFMPTNFNGNAFRTGPSVRWKRVPGSLLRRWRGLERSRQESFLEWLYEKGCPISIQEHFSTARSIGNRQDPNLYDDLDSVKKIYSFLRGADLWYTGLNELSRYIANRAFTELYPLEDGFRLDHKGKEHDPYVSVRSGLHGALRDEEGKRIHGVRKGAAWVFDHLRPGTYYFDEG